MIKWWRARKRRRLKEELRRVIDGDRAACQESIRLQRKLGFKVFSLSEMYLNPHLIRVYSIEKRQLSGYQRYETEIKFELLYTGMLEGDSINPYTHTGRLNYDY